VKHSEKERDAGAEIAPLKMDAPLSPPVRTRVWRDMGLETKITYLDGVRFHVTARGHEIVSDQPPENCGTDGGMTPPELMLASLGSCAAYYAAEYLRARKIPITGLSVTVTAEKEMKPARLTNFRVALSIPGLSSPRHQDGILRAAKNCLIHNTLLHSPVISIELEGENVEIKHGSLELAEKL
jgi:uncharacterized OsmC-like protein